MRLKKTVALALVTAMAATMAAGRGRSERAQRHLRARRQAAKQQAARLTARRQRKGLPQGKSRN